MSREDDAMKEAVKAALREWLDEKYNDVGRWTVHGLMAAAVGWGAYAFLWSNGWHK